MTNDRAWQKKVDAEMLKTAQIRRDRDRWRRVAEGLADQISLIQRGDYEGARDVLEEAYEAAGND